MTQSKAVGWKTVVAAFISIPVMIGCLMLERRDRPVTADDLRIVTRTKALLQNDQAWNRNDDRECTDDESSGKRSLFCALQKATDPGTGEYDHRRVALQEVRFAIEDATRGQDFDHRLRDYNNLPLKPS